MPIASDYGALVQDGETVTGLIVIGLVILLLLWVSMRRKK